jgi:hypothetical protein
LLNRQAFLKIICTLFHRNASIKHANTLGHAHQYIAIKLSRSPISPTPRSQNFIGSSAKTSGSLIFDAPSRPRRLGFESSSAENRPISTLDESVETVDGGSADGSFRRQIRRDSLSPICRHQLQYLCPKSGYCLYTGHSYFLHIFVSNRIRGLLPFSRTFIVLSAVRKEIKFK